MEPGAWGRGPGGPGPRARGIFYNPKAFWPKMADPALRGPHPVLGWPIFERLRDRRGRLEGYALCNGVGMEWHWPVDRAIAIIARRLRDFLQERDPAFED